MKLLYCLLSLSYQIRDLIWWQRKLPNETITQSLQIVVVDTKFGGNPAPFRQTLQFFLVPCIVILLRNVTERNRLFK